MKKLSLLTITVLSLFALVACSDKKEETVTNQAQNVAQKDTTTEQSIYTKEELTSLDEFAQTFEKWLNQSAPAKAYMEDNKVHVSISGYDFSSNSDETILGLSETILETKQNVFETYKITNKDLKEPLLVLKDGTGKTYAVENEEHKMEIKK